MLWRGGETIIPAESNDNDDIDWFVYNAKLITANGLDAWHFGPNYHVFYPGNYNLWTEVDDYSYPSNTNLNNGDFSYFKIFDINQGSDTMTASFRPYNQFGNVQYDSIIDILDIVITVNIILEILHPTDFQFWAV